MKQTAEAEWLHRVREAIWSVIENLDNPPTYRDLADRAGFSAYHFHRAFRALVGESPAELSRRLLLERAAHELNSSDRSVGEIALDAGFETPETFTRAYRAAFNATPSHHRRHGNTIIWLGSPNGIHYRVEGPPEVLDLLHHGDNPMEVRTENATDRTFLLKTHKGHYSGLGQAWGEFAGWAGPRGLFGPTTITGTIYVSDHDTTAPDDLLSDLCITCPEGFDAPEGMKVGQLPQGRCAVGTFVGSYQDLGDGWDKMYGEVLPQNGFTPRSEPCFEIYIDNPATTPPEKLRTELWVPIE